MKVKKMILLMALTITTLVACNATSSENKAETAAMASATGNNLPLDLTFLKNMGVDAEMIHDIND